MDPLTSYRFWYAHWPERRHAHDHLFGREAAVVVTRSGREAADIISVREYESLKETAYLMASPANARRLNEAVEELRHGGGQLRDLNDPEGSAGEAPTA